MDGWIKDYRQELESAIWLMPPLYDRVWQYLKYSANHSDAQIPMRDGTKFPISRGQHLASYRGIARGVSWYEGKAYREPNPKTIKNICEWLEKNGMIIQSHGRGNGEYTLITLVNWDLYQCDGNEGVTANTHQSNTKVTARKQLVDTNKNDKNNENEKEDKPLGEVSPHKTLIDYFCDKHFEKTGMKYLFDGGKDGKVIQSLLRAYDPEFLKGFIYWYFSTDDQFIATCGYGIGKLKIAISKYIAEKGKGDVDSGNKLARKNQRLDESEEFFNR